MGSDLRKFVNPKFIKTVDPALMFVRHFGEDDLPLSFDGEAATIRAALMTHFEGTIAGWNSGMVADLHRVAELGTSEGMQLILNEARRRSVVLYPEPEPAPDADGAEAAPVRHDPKHVALHTYLLHHGVFEAAADFHTLRAPNSPAEFRGPERDVGADLTDAMTAAFKAAAITLFSQDLQGQYCRLGPYEEDGEINLVISHGAQVTTTPVITGDREEIITLRAVKYAVLRYSPVEGRLFVGGVVKAQQGEIAELFARHILRRPGFFAGRDARDLYTLDTISDAGTDFAFQHLYDESIKEVRIVAAAADLFERDEDEQRWRHVRSWESKDASGGALTHFRGSEVRFGRAGGWARSRSGLHLKPAQTDRHRSLCG